MFSKLVFVHWQAFPAQSCLHAYTIRAPFRCAGSWPYSQTRPERPDGYKHSGLLGLCVNEGRNRKKFYKNGPNNKNNHYDKFNDVPFDG